MAVLITGITGFLGSHIARKLVANREIVVGLKRKSSQTEKINDLLGNLILYDNENLDFSSLIEKYNIKCIIHAATFYDRNNQNTNEVIEANFIFPKKIIDRINDKNVLFINISSFFCRNLDLSKIDLTKPNAAYIFSKILFENYGKFVASFNNLKFINVRLEHIYGPDDDLNSKFIPKTIKLMLDNVESISLSDCTQKRDFIFVSDVVNAILLIYENNNFLYQQFNTIEIGSGTSIPLFELTEKIKLITCTSSVLKYGDFPKNENDILDSKADVSFLNKIGWTQEVTLDQGLLETISSIKIKCNID